MPNRIRSIAIALVLFICAVLAWTTNLDASPGGRSGLAQSATGCSCHGSTPNGSGPVTVQISGPQQLAPGGSGSYTVTVTGGPAGTNGGFDLKATGGTFTPGTNNKILNGDLTHSSASFRSWSFDWQAPATPGSYSFYAIGLAANGSGTDGDSWNWYGDAVNTAFAITVATTGVEHPGTGLWLAPASPNPVRMGCRLAYTLPRASHVRLEVVDAAVRRVAGLREGFEQAGTHTLRWDGTDSRGASVASGLYFVRLAADGRVLHTRVVVAR